MSGIIISLIFSTISALTTNQSLPQKNREFTISTQANYNPGEEIAVNVYSYTYDSENSKVEDLETEFTIYKISDLEKFFSNQNSNQGLDLLGKDSSILLNTVKQVKKFKKTLSPVETYGYSSINEAVKIDVTDKGAYLVRVESENMVAHCGFMISEISLIAKAGLNSMIGYCAYSKSGDAAVNAKMSFFLGSRKIGEGIASDGSFYQEILSADEIISDEKTQPLIIAKQGEDIAISDPYLFFGYSENRYDTYIFTEQPV